MRTRSRDRLATAGLVVGFLLAWETASRLGMASMLLFPPPSESGASLARLIVEGDIPRALGNTVWRLLRGTLVGVSAGTAVGLWLGLSPRAHRVADPIVSALHPIPKLTLLPLALVIFGLGDASHVAIIGISTAFPMAINVVAGARSIDPLHAQVAGHYGLDGAALIRQVILPGSMPFVTAGLRLALNSAFHVTLAVELIFATRGLGGLLWRAWERFALDEFYATLLVIAIVGLLITSAVNALARRMSPWQATP